MKMKKILAAVLAGVMALSATACSSSSTKKIESPDDFAGAKISVQTGTTAHDALQKMQEEGVDVEILPYEKIITIDRLFTFQITCDNMRKSKGE